MGEPTFVEYLKFANLQMAAEALYGFNATPPGTNLTPGQAYSGSVLDRYLTDGNLHASRFTASEAAKVSAGWIVLQHISNTTTGFSGTLFQNKDSGERVLCFRSTEFVDDAARENEATNKLEIAEKGWAFGQIADMRGWVAGIFGLLGEGFGTRDFGDDHSRALIVASRYVHQIPAKHRRWRHGDKARYAANRNLRRTAA